ncbi:hypothetical protein C2L80_01570 [Rubneribacter badeniensis]|uniref:L-asparaginase N-terminal domain-containing protein n=1 Tax=Rubneribacter badeniensis TaxID=2070688 RepID=A0A2K2U7W6_9ACTN|nr:hypothetical protein C2L80_01570 [Rubneribacter badeniensis]
MGICELDIIQPSNIDNASIQPANQMHIHDVIIGSHNCHDKLMVLHGTNTASYTATALSHPIKHSEKIHRACQLAAAYRQPIY